MHPGQKQHEQLSTDNLKLKSKLNLNKKDPSKVFNDEYNPRTVDSSASAQQQTNVINLPTHDSVNDRSSSFAGVNTFNNKNRNYASKNSTPQFSDLTQPLLVDCKVNEKNTKLTPDLGDYTVDLNRLSPISDKRKLSEKLKSSSESTITFEHSIRTDRSESRPKTNNYSSYIDNTNTNVNKNNNFDLNAFKLPFLNNKLFNTTTINKSSAGGLPTTPKSSLQAQIYNFLERPTGWKCFIYHFTVYFTLNLNYLEKKHLIEIF